MEREGAAARFFRDAQHAFDTGDFVTAVKFATQAEKLAPLEMRVSVPKSTAPSYSLIAIGSNIDTGAIISSLGRGLGYVELILVSALDGVINPHIKTVQIGFDYGYSGARNLGAHAAEGEFLIFIGDGMPHEGTISHLAALIHEKEAVVISGRACSTEASALHRGDDEQVIYAVPEVAAVSIWRRRQFLAHGGFDILLTEREGLALWSKMYRFYGPEASLYSPHAVLLSDNPRLQKIGRNRQRRESAYFNYAYPDAERISIRVARQQQNARTQFFHARSYCNLPLTKRTSPLPSISVLTVAKNSQRYIKDFTQALKAQTLPAFELIFVDDNSLDDSMLAMTELWKDDPRLRQESSSGGLSAGLNQAIAHAQNDLCAIANVEDISHPRRLELSVRYLEQYPRCACLSFATFNNKVWFNVPFLESPLGVGMRTRSLLGMPASFPTFAFRKSNFGSPFDASLTSGYSCAWLHANFDHEPLDGRVIPLNLVFCRNPRRDLGADVERSLTYLAMRNLVGSLSEHDKWSADILSGSKVLSPDDDVSRIGALVDRILTHNARLKRYDQRELEDFLLQRLVYMELQHKISYKTLENEMLKLQRQISVASGKERQRRFWRIWRA